MGIIHSAEEFFQCCGYDETDQQSLPDEEQAFCIDKISSCSAIPTTPAVSASTTPTNSTTAGKRRKRALTPDCQTCKALLDDKIDRGFNAAGGLGLFFALTEVCYSQFLISTIY